VNATAPTQNDTEYATTDDAALTSTRPSRASPYAAISPAWRHRQDQKLPSSTDPPSFRRSRGVYVVWDQNARDRAQRCPPCFRMRNSSTCRWF